MMLKKGILLALIAAPAAFANGPHPREVYIIDARYSGTGCPAGSVAYDLSPDAKAITLLFSDYLVEAQGGPWGGSTRTHKACRIDLQMHVPQGWSYALFDVDFRGYAFMSNRDAEVSQSARYSFGDRAIEVGRLDMRGPYNDSYLSHRQIPLESLVWSPCGARKDLTIQTEIAAKARSLARAMITVDSIDGQLSQTYGIAWRPCSNPDDHRQPNPYFYTGRCRVVLETIWGTDIRDFWGQISAADPNEAIRLSMDHATEQCEEARNNQFLYRCTKVHSSCSVR